MFRRMSDELTLWRLGVRLETAADAAQLGWLVRRCGANRVRLAAVRRTVRLAPRPAAVAAELRLELPSELQQDLRADYPELAARGALGGAAAAAPRG